MGGNAVAAVCYVVLGSAVACAAAFGAPEEGGERVLRSAGGYKSERDPSGLRDVGSLEEVRIPAGERITRPKGSLQTLASYSPDHWIYDAGVEVFFDADEDGYYRYIRVTFDVDSNDHKAWVFAALYLSADGELFELYHETDDFRVDGTSPDDVYEVETELVSSYPPGLYDLLIEIYDADTGVLVDELGPADTSALSLLPLEDRANDRELPPVVVTHEHGGGAVSWPFLLLLLAAGGAARVARRRSA